MIAAKEGSVFFEPMPNDATFAMTASRCQGMDGAFEAIENVLLCREAQPGHGMRSIRYGATTVLISDDFGALTRPLQVRQAAVRIINLINGALFLHDESRGVLAIGSICERRNGSYVGHAIAMPAGVVARARAGALAVALNGVVAPPPAPREAIWVDKAGIDNVLADVLNRDFAPCKIVLAGNASI